MYIQNQGSFRSPDLLISPNHEQIIFAYCREKAIFLREFAAFVPE